jgi:tetratricopeptide (TPR) repeat protein
LQVASWFARRDVNFGGVAKASEGDLNGAIGEFNRLIQLNPKDEIAYYNRGLLEANKGDFDIAIANLVFL